MAKHFIISALKICSCIGFLFMHSCAPVFNEMQSARTVGKNRLEATGSYSAINYASDGESEQVQEEAGLHIAYGLSDKIDLRARYEMIWADNIDDQVNVIAIGPKFSLVEKNVSFYMPVGNALGDYDDNWQLQPTFLLTLPIARDRIEFTLAPKYLITFCSDCDDGVAVNFGLSAGELNNWALRLEYGLLYNVNEFDEGHNGQFSFGVSYTFGKSPAEGK